MPRRTTIALLIAVAFVALYRPAAAEEASDVLALTKSTFDKTLGKEKLILVEFYAPWCGHCKALAPEYEKAATELKSSGIPLAKVDCTAEDEVCKQHGVQGYPTLKVFREGAPGDYQGPRKADSIVSYMKKQLLPALSEVTSKNAQTFIDSDKVVVVGFFQSTDSAEYKALLAVANKLRDSFLFGATVDAAVIKKHDVKTPAVILFKKFDEGKAVFDGEFTESELTQFVTTASTPLLAELGPDNYGKYIETGLPLAYLFAENEDDLAKYRPIMEGIAKTYKGKINVVHIDAVKYSGHGKQLGLETFPGIVIQIPNENTKYIFDKTLNKKEVTAFFKDYVAGKIKPHFKSEPVPEEPYEGDVRVIVGNNFKDVVLDANKDVFVEFYAPWCGHCKKLAPTWETLAENYKSHKDKVVIAKMDATANDIPPESPFKGVQGFPTLVLFKAGSKETVNYEGDRSLESLIQFVEGNASNKTGVSAEDEVEDGAGGHDEL